MEIKPENLLSVRGLWILFQLVRFLSVHSFTVGRVVARKVDVSSFVTAEEYGQFFRNNHSTIESLPLPENVQSDWVLVPNSYSNIYLGEVFSFYINCTNDSIQ